MKGSRLTSMSSNFPNLLMALNIADGAPHRPTAILETAKTGAGPSSLSSQSTGHEETRHHRSRSPIAGSWCPPTVSSSPIPREILDRRRSPADLLRVRQHAGRQAGQDRRDDRKCMLRTRRACTDLFWGPAPWMHCPHTGRHDLALGQSRRGPTALPRHRSPW